VIYFYYSIAVGGVVGIFIAVTDGVTRDFFLKFKKTVIFKNITKHTFTGLEIFELPLNRDRFSLPLTQLDTETRVVPQLVNY
jgi:hypothetical protein